MQAAEQTHLPSMNTATQTLPAGLVKFAKDCTAGTLGGIAVVGVGHPFGTRTSFKNPIQCFVLIHFMALSTRSYHSCIFRYRQGASSNPIHHEPSLLWCFGLSQENPSMGRCRWSIQGKIFINSLFSQQGSLSIYSHKTHIFFCAHSIHFLFRVSLLPLPVKWSSEQLSSALLVLQRDGYPRTLTEPPAN